MSTTTTEDMMSNLPDGMLPGDESQADDPLDYYRELVDKKVAEHDCPELYEDEDFCCAVDDLLQCITPRSLVLWTEAYSAFREREAQRLLKADNDDKGQILGEAAELMRGVARGFAR